MEFEAAPENVAPPSRRGGCSCVCLLPPAGPPGLEGRRPRARGEACVRSLRRQPAPWGPLLLGSGSQFKSTWASSWPEQVPRASVAKGPGSSPSHIVSLCPGYTRIPAAEPTRPGGWSVCRGFVAGRFLTSGAFSPQPVPRAGRRDPGSARNPLALGPCCPLLSSQCLRNSDLPLPHGAALQPGAGPRPHGPDLTPGFVGTSRPSPDPWAVTVKIQGWLFPEMCGPAWSWRRHASGSVAFSLDSACVHSGVLQVPAAGLRSIGGVDLTPAPCGGGSGPVRVPYSKSLLLEFCSTGLQNPFPIKFLFTYRHLGGSVS